MLARQTPGGESRPLPIGSRLIGVSLRPAIPRRVAPQQSPPPLHQSATIVAEPATPIKCEARPHRCHLGCHLYFARRVTFLSCADMGPWLSATGIGTLDLEPRHIDFLWQPDIAGLGSARIAITGDWDNPQYKVQAVTITKDLGLPRGLKLR